MTAIHKEQEKINSNSSSTHFNPISSPKDKTQETTTRKKANYNIFVLILKLFILFLLPITILSVSLSGYYYYSQKDTYDLSLNKNTYKVQSSKYPSLVDLGEMFLPESQKGLKINQSNFANNIAPQFIGNQNVRLVFARPSTVDGAVADNIVRILSSTTPDPFEECDSEYCYTYFSLYSGKKLIEQEAKKYPNSNLTVNLNIEKNVLVLDDLGVIGDVINNQELGVFDITTFEDSFSELLTQNNINIVDDEKVIFFYFDDRGGDEIDENNAFAGKTFRSFANKYRHIAFVNIVQLDPLYSFYYTEVFVHEYLHLFGATDKYIEGEDLVCEEQGIGDLEKTPLYPQETADIMCGNIIRDPKNPNLNEAGSLIDNNLTINSLTAEEIGWK